MSGVHEAAMKVTFYGVRGSIPTPLSGEAVNRKVVAAMNEAIKKKLTAAQAEKAAAEAPVSLGNTFGGNTMCVEVSDGDKRLILDGGSGLRIIGNKLMREKNGGVEAHILFSHFHVDHIHGVPFFVPIFIPGCKIHFYGGHDHVLSSISKYINPPFFPIAYEDLASTRTVTVLTPGKKHEINGFTVSLHALNHPNGCYAYRIERGGKTVIYATDSEFMDRPPEEFRGYVDFFRGADCLIADAQYSIADSLIAKIGWGHSSCNIDIDLACDAGVKKLVFCHYDPLADDDELEQMLTEANEYLKVMHPKKKLELALAQEEAGFTV